MPLERTNTLVVGGGQAGLAMSAHLRSSGVDHIVLETRRNCREMGVCQMGLSGNERTCMA